MVCPSFCQNNETLRALQSAGHENKLQKASQKQLAALSPSNRNPAQSKDRHDGMRRCQHHVSEKQDMQTWQQLAGTGHIGAPASGVGDNAQHDDQHDQKSLLPRQAQSSSTTCSTEALQSSATLLMCQRVTHARMRNYPTHLLANTGCFRKMQSNN